ncbi:MAG: hypothetical protein U0892_21510 [Pirellulales bacterium]
MLRIALCVVVLSAMVGCGYSGTKVDAPSKFLPPTQPASSGSGGNTQEDGNTKKTKDGQAATLQP